MLNSHDVSDRRILAAVRELRSLNERRFTTRQLQVPFQRGWRRDYVLNDRALNREDRPVLEAILKVIGSTFVHHTRNFQHRRGRSRKLCEIEQPLRPIPLHEWERKNYPQSWHRYFQYQLLLTWGNHWQPHWVFTQPSFYRLKTSRNMIFEIRVIDPDVERRIGELERWLELNQAWARYGSLKGRRQSWRWCDGEARLQKLTNKRHRQEISRARENFPEVDPAASVWRIPTSLRPFLFLPA
ncbi:MAG: hypothetical protein EOP88_10035 [Verrucomicrobiaceae bacterium]|nr:MAG: hypothetical protein EOP88_10035 [Verrucomicrobiaceae bacterium]